MQVPAPFDYRRATSVGDAIALLQDYGPDSRVIAGGHSLLPMMRLRLARPEVLIDINHLTELDYIRVDGSFLKIGAMVRHVTLQTSHLAAEYYPIFAEAEAQIADPLVRNRGTVGGSLCQADPAEDLSAVFSALKANVVIAHRSGTRKVPISEFHTGPYTTILEADEILTEVEVPLRSNTGSAYEKVERRVGDWAIAAVGAMVRIEEGLVSEAGIGLTAVRADHFRAKEAEDSLVGRPPSTEAIAEAASLAATHCDPFADQRGPEDYKRHLVEELTKRALSRAMNRSLPEVH
ncbi:MAG: xanthine dehydrogenase family protein subunit M [Acidimicrobiaceae bacterium]|nr:xanthine dehydrogenase family protein subunit M [Acidimicrobiaceae bacterium]